MNKVLVILGSTSTGKTDLALFLAKKFDGELISADSRQVYVGLDLGTGKMPSKISNVKFQMSNGWWKIDGVKIWLYDVVSPNKQYTVYNFIKDARIAIEQINKNKKLPIIVGGTNFYLRALLAGFPNLGIPVNISLRKRLEKLSLHKLQKQLQELSLKKWNLMNNSDKQNPRRLVRAIELEISPRRSPFGHLRGVSSSHNVLKIGLTAPREILYKRIDERVIFRINQGMITEAKSLHERGLSLKRMRQLGLEYGVLADYLAGKIRGIQGDQGLNKILQRKIHGYARRQITWFKKEKDVNWFDVTEKDFISKVENLVAKWYHQANAA